jgi:hypothetical protein
VLAVVGGRRASRRIAGSRSTPDDAMKLTAQYGLVKLLAREKVTTPRAR